MRTSPMLCPRNVIVYALVLCAWTVSSAHAAVVTYTFESPQFIPGESTPLLNRAPNVGDPTFRTDFTTAPNTTGFDVAPFQPNPLFSGNSLFDPLGGLINTLTLTFNTPVNSVQFVFGMNLLPNGPPGFITLTSPAGSQTQAAGNVGGIFQGGTFSFSSSTPFTTLQLEAFDSAGGRVEFAIDNLTLNTVPEAVIPEPASLTLLALGAVGLAGAARRRRSVA
jgi:hypothetical protein